jgi:hypothetical protein
MRCHRCVSYAWLRYCGHSHSPPRTPSTPSTVPSLPSATPQKNLASQDWLQRATSKPRPPLGRRPCGARGAHCCVVVAFIPLGLSGVSVSQKAHPLLTASAGAHAPRCSARSTPALTSSPSYASPTCAPRCPSTRRTRHCAEPPPAKPYSSAASANRGPAASRVQLKLPSHRAARGAVRFHKLAPSIGAPAAGARPKKGGGGGCPSGAAALGSATSTSPLRSTRAPPSKAAPAGAAGAGAAQPAPAGEVTPRRSAAPGPSVEMSTHASPRTASTCRGRGAPLWASRTHRLWSASRGSWRGRRTSSSV